MFFIAWVLVGHLLLNSVFIALVVDDFNLHYGVSTGATLSPACEKWLESCEDAASIRLPAKHRARMNRMDRARKVSNGCPQTHPHVDKHSARIRA